MGHILDGSATQSRYLWRPDRFWTEVAIAIADAEGREIGVTGADRFPQV